MPGWRGGERETETEGEGGRDEKNVPLTSEGWQRQKSDPLLPASGTKLAFPFPESHRSPSRTSLQDQKRDLIPRVVQSDTDANIWNRRMCSIDPDSTVELVNGASCLLARSSCTPLLKWKGGLSAAVTLDLRCKQSYV